MLQAEHAFHQLNRMRLNYIESMFNEGVTVSLIDLTSRAKNFSQAWKSQMISRIGSAQIKVLRMDEAPLAEEEHPYTEALLVLEGVCNLVVNKELIPMNAGEVYIVPAGQAHRVGNGSWGTLLIIDEAE